MHQPEPERDHPAPAELRRDDVLERHVDDRDGDERLDERREPQSVGREAVRRGNQRDRVRDRERCDDGDERSQSTERDDEAEQKQQVIDPVEDVVEPELDELQRRLVPARIQPHQARVADDLEGAHGAARRQEPKNGHRPQSQSSEPRLGNHSSP